MILLTATRLDVYARVQFTVQPDEAPKAIVTTKSGLGGEGSFGPHFISWAARPRT